MVQLPVEKERKEGDKKNGSQEDINRDRACHC